MKKKEKFYITTPIYYVNDRPHLGTAYSTLISDIFNRYNNLFGRETFFLTGTDEHGQKCQQAAEKRGKAPKQHCDEMSQTFKQAWEILNIRYDHFVRTSDESHKKTVQFVLNQLWEQGDIYEDLYKGWYSVSEEIFYTDKDVKDGKSPSGRDVVPIEEKNYFFKMSKYQDLLKRHLEENPRFVFPQTRQNELKGFLREPLQDLCISRPKARVHWGVELPFDANYVAYVWVDALVNYISAIGFLDNKEMFQKWWKEGVAVHLIGKDILMTHGVYWSCLLMALKLPLPKHLIAHGWLLNKEEEKMSKSKGEVLNPLELEKTLGVDALRYFLAREVVIGQDLFISKEMMIQRTHQDLSDNLGNIYSRLSRLVEKYFEKKIPALCEGEDREKYQALTEETCLFVKSHVESFRLSQSLEKVQQLLSEVNRFLEQKAPWKLVKTDLKEAGSVIYISFEVLRISAILLSPVMPEKMNQLLQLLGSQSSWKDTQWGGLSSGQTLSYGLTLFPKIT